MGSITGENSHTRPRRRLFTLLKAAALIVILLVAAAGIGGYLYWRSLKGTPQYSLALLIDAARRDDAEKVAELVDMDSVVDDFVPQITEKAAEIYGRGLPPETLELARVAAEPLLPALKDRARAELPRLIREKTDAFANVPFFAMAAAADKYLNIVSTGETAAVRSISPQYSFEVTMQKSGDKWHITGIRDDELATRIARTVGDDVLRMFGGNGAETPTPENLSEMLKLAEETLKQE